jgi:hypothetical protein
MSDVPYREVTEAEATEAGLPGQPDTTYRRHADGDDYAYNAGTLCYWKLGRSPFGDSPDRDRTPIGRAVDKAQAALNESIEADGGRVLASVMLVHAEGVEPTGGVDANVDAADGPQDPDDLLAFILFGVGQLAERYGLTFRVMDVPDIGGQG